MVTKWQEVNVLIKYPWRCKACGNKGGKLGFTMKKDSERTYHCFYCDVIGQQVAGE